MMGRKRNWRSGSDPIYEPPDAIHMWWLLPIYAAVALGGLLTVLATLYLIIWTLV